MIKQRIKEEKKMIEDQEQRKELSIKNGEKTENKSQFTRNLKNLKVTEKNIERLIKLKQQKEAKKFEITFGEENKKKAI